jgi:DNA polymerase III subunit epsilon
MIIFDTETTGLCKAANAPLKQQPRIIEFAAIKVEPTGKGTKLKEVDRMDFLCNPGEPLAEIITTLTGLTDKDLKGQPSFAKFYPALVKFFVGENTMTAHNVEFDRNLLKFELMRMDRLLQFPWPARHICTIEQSFSIAGKKQNLGSLHKIATGDEFEGAHRAMADTEALFRCVQFLHDKGLFMKKKGK